MDDASSWWIRSHHENDAQSFFEALSPTAGILDATYLPEQHWIYRGHGRSDYPLLPSAFREGKKLLRNLRWYETPCATMELQISAELETLYAFMLMIDRQGY